jgi:uncharacterized protein YceK
MTIHARKACTWLVALIGMVLPGVAAHAAKVLAIYQFPAPNGNGEVAGGFLPLAGLTPATDGSGNLFGTTSRGGSYKTNGYGGGVTYALTPPATGQTAWTETVLHAFTGGTDGIFPGNGNLLLQAGNLFGTTAGQALLGNCGRVSCDTIYELSPPASGKTAWTYTLLYRFAGGSDGYNPQGGLIAGPAGALYGTTAAGGNSGCQSSYTNSNGTTGCGTIFQLTPPTSGTGWTKTVLHTFSGGTDGGLPLAALLADPTSSGVFYGTASTGGGGTCSFGAANCGVVFALTPPAQGKTAWTETVLYSFAGGADGLAPLGALIMQGGVLYGTAISGGYGCNIYGCGTVFSLTPPAKGKTAWTFNALYAFKGGTDGGVPMAAVTAIKNGTLFGTTFQYGDTKIDCGRFIGCGTIFKLTPPKSGTTWAETPLYTFTGATTGGQSTASLSMQGKRLYGTTALGGRSQCPPTSAPTCGGVVFSLPQ